MLIKNIKLKNEKDKNRFLKKLYLYRSFLFKFIYFDTDSPDSDIEVIIHALNLKKRKERITFIYDKAIEEIDNFYKKKDICCFQNGTCLAHRELQKNYKNGCCRWCHFQSDTGCTTQNIACKFFVCDSVRKNCKVLEFADVKILKVLSKGQQALLKKDFFSSRDSVIGDLNRGLILGTIRMYLRLIVRAAKTIF